MLNRSAAFPLAGAVGVATMTAASAPSPLYPVYQRLWGFSDSMLTLVFAAYVFALLGALLTVGSLSDHVGRRPVASAALGLLAVGMLLFTLASGPGGLMVARVVQGLAVGTATGTVTAMILDTAPGPRSGSVLSSGVPPFGLAVGAVLSGALVELAPWPRQLVFWVLGTVYLLLAVAVWLVPDSAVPSTSTRREVWRSVLPTVGLPRQVRPAFFALVPVMTATWALAGLYLSLGSSIIGSVLDVHNHLTASLALGAFFMAGAAGTIGSTVLPPALREPIGCATLAVGVLMTVVATLTASLPVYVIGSLMAGFGFGASFRHAVSALGDATPTEHRGQVFATMYIASYVAFSVPALVAGVASERLGLRPTAVAYGVVVVALVLIAFVASRARAAHPVTASTDEGADVTASAR